MLDDKQIKFIDNYIQSYAVEMSAIKAGYPKEDALKIGLDLLSNSTIKQAIEERENALNQDAKSLKMNKEKLLRTMYFLYSQSVKDRQITQAVNILEKIATWSGVNPDEVQLDPVQLIINNLDENKI
jgi:phage terminase small subunit